ncbi:hypothetical protein BKA62DRAFT_686204 [Auriculariales sp. MPI-PUGE-AT-0066]|nr:hypothetical protein BKA62DRAFT_686204 [Auriculariales sp. MPI-PUGE-AT-0066]
MPPTRRVHVYTVVPFGIPILPTKDDVDGVGQMQPITNVVFSNLTNVEPRTRRKIAPKQLEVLEALYGRNTHPDRSTRQVCAEEAGMDLKAVTIWLQNKRQAVKKAGGTPMVAATSSSVTTKKDSKASPPKLRRTASAPALAPSSPSHGMRLSLDIFASRPNPAAVARRRVVSERCGVLDAQTQRAACAATPDRDRDQLLELWERMPASPVHPPSSPAMEYAKLDRAERTLEWACARDRARWSRRQSSPSTVYEDIGSDSASQFTVEDDVVRTPETSFAVVAVPSDGKVNDVPPPSLAPSSPESNKSADEESAASILLMLAGRS